MFTDLNCFPRRISGQWRVLEGRGLGYPRHPRCAGISSIELGKVSVGIEVANQLASALDLRFSELVKLAE
jgi:hypothetical protein